MMPVWQLRAVESFIHALSLAGNMLGKLIGNRLKDIRFNYVSYAVIEKLIRWQRRRGQGRDLPSGFLIEIYNPSQKTINLKLHMGVEGAYVPPEIPISQRPRPYAEKLVVEPGYFRHFIAWDKLGEVVKSSLAFDVSLIPEDTTDLQLVFLMLDFVKLSETNRNTQQSTDTNSSSRPDVKCVVFDLDNTVWDGVILERDDVALRPGVRELIEKLDKRGILLSVASKNAHDHAWKKLEDFGLAEYFLFPKINWLPKSKSIRQIAENLNIGLDTFAFIDDNPAELSEVGSALPEVECFHVDELEGLAEHPRLKGSDSAEASQRRKFYQDATVREESLGTFGDDYFGFLKSCDIQLDIRAFKEEHFGRSVELVQRTNQLNFSGRKYNREQIREIIDQPDLEKWVLSCNDKFGSYGIVGFCMVHRKGAIVEIKDFMLSCRVQGKFIEQALFSFLTTNAKGAAVEELCVQFFETDRNKAAQQVLSALGFQANGKGELILDITRNSLICDFIQITTDQEQE